MNQSLKELADELAQKAAKAKSQLEYLNALCRLQGIVDALTETELSSDTCRYVLNAYSKAVAKPFQAA